MSAKKKGIAHKNSEQQKKKRKNIINSNLLTVQLCNIFEARWTLKKSGWTPSFNPKIYFGFIIIVEDCLKIR